MSLILQRIIQQQFQCTLSSQSSLILELLRLTTVSSTSAMYMQEVLEAVCRRRRLSNPKEWALLSTDEKILIPLDRTVASLEGSSELVLVLRTNLPKYGFAIDADRRTTGRQVDPNASIFRRISEIQPKNKLLDLEYKVCEREENEAFWASPNFSIRGILYIGKYRCWSRVWREPLLLTEITST